MPQIVKDTKRFRIVQEVQEGQLVDVDIFYCFTGGHEFKRPSVLRRQESSENRERNPVCPLCLLKEFPVPH